MITIINTGTLSSFQDFGRFGKKKYGVSNSGCLDKFSFMLSNLLCKNDKNEASIEIISGGFKGVFLEDITASITGPDGFFTVNDNKKIRINSSINLKKNDTLFIPPNNNGNVFYLSVSGGFKLQEILGSYSYHQPSDITNDLKIISGLSYHFKNPDVHKEKFTNDEFFKKYLNNDGIIYINYDRDILESHQKFINKFESTDYCTSNQYSRQGIKLTGKKNNFFKNQNEISSEVSLGTLQLPPSGLPIILLNDSQTTGGYKKIGSIPKLELSKFSQLKPGSKIRFNGLSIKNSNLFFNKMVKDFELISLNNYCFYHLNVNGGLISVQISGNNSIISIANNEVFNVFKE
jgi:antagonist of KipI|tara:strand:- start:14853 stop:15893 length:1041 start_codon:yes stop_codon:yes gene_type:complete